MTALPQSTLEAMAKIQNPAMWKNIPSIRPELLEAAAIVLQAALDEGGIVLTSDYQHLAITAQRVIDAWDQFNDPKIRVGPVYPRMNDLRQELER